MAASGENAAGAFAYLKAWIPLLKTECRGISGLNAAKRLEKSLRESAEQISNTTDAAECAIRFICLMIEKSRFRFVDSVLREIELLINRQTGIIDVTVETAFPLENDVKEKLTQVIKEQYNAAGVKIKNLLKTEILGGYCLRIGGFYIDASLKGQIKQMKADLIAAAAAPITAAGGGNNGEL